ncbi:hypothetical protein HU200_017524 [Digitaria exilis]|uniref:At1g61320/AtMIF1 LRR domain-containing protein n=1 Tax=Digitaria exilis TaxID=1010633 RepID=A0A835KH83_9POAL|nr:hypothetical protein HU200_017524 [Digitaria exilis]
MPMRDAAQVACVAQAFVRSWRCHPSLDFNEETLGLIQNGCRKDENARDFNNKVDHILDKHSGIGIKELRLILTTDEKYNFPISLLYGQTGDSLWYLSLACCHFHPTDKFGCFRNLTKLKLTLVHITATELGWFLSSSFALEQLKLRYCNDIDCLKIPCLLKLSYLEVVCCTGLQAIESKAPNLSSVSVVGGLHVQFSLENARRIKILNRHSSNFTGYARTNLPSIMPNLEALSIRSDVELVNTPMMPSKFLHLKFLNIAIGGLTFDFLSLASFLVASPSLETFILEVGYFFEDNSNFRMMPGHHHSKLKCAKIIKFSAAKSVAELTCHILESATCSVKETGKCIFLLKEALVEARRGALAAQTFIKPKVPSTVEFNVLEPCSWCHAVEL